MRDRVPDRLEKGRLHESDPDRRTYPGEWYGRFLVRGPRGDYLFLVVSAGLPEEWAACGFEGPAFEHVSVTVRNPCGRREDRCPTWEEMAWVKDLCWGPDECVVQYHPPRAAYVNHHPYCLHLWKPVGVELPLPPAATVGPLTPAGG